jgi:hypothetical protein
MDHLNYQVMPCSLWARGAVMRSSVAPLKFVAEVSLLQTVLYIISYPKIHQGGSRGRQEMTALPYPYCMITSS